MSQLTLITEKRLFDFLAPKKEDIIKLMGGEMMYKKEISFAIQAANSNSQLQQATPESVCKAIYNCAITGLSLNPVMKLAYLTPRKSGDNTEAQLMPSYQGLVKLLKDSGCVRQVYAHCRYDGDDFDYSLGTEVTIKHTPKFTSKNIIGVYAVAVLPDNERVVEYMNREEVEGIRARSDGYRAYTAGKIKSTPWVTDEQEMFRKTVIRRIFKYVPKTDRYNKVAEAIALDGAEYPATIGQINYIEALISTSTYDHDTQDMLAEKAATDLSSAEAENMIADLREHQLDPVTQGKNYSVTEAKEAAKR